MKKRVGGLVALGVLAGPLLILGQFDSAKWNWRAPLVTSPRNGIVALPLDGEIYDNLLNPPQDLRVVNGSGALVPHAIRCGRTATASSVVSRAVRIINRTYTPGLSSHAVLDFGEHVIKNRLRVRLSGQNYLRKVAVEGGDDQAKWETIAENLLLFDVRIPNQSHHVDTLTFPDNNFQFLRLTVENSPDDTDHAEIQEVTAFYEEPAGDAQFAVAEVANRVVAQENKSTVVTLDLRFQNLPIHHIVLDAADPMFHRSYTVEGRNTITHKVYRRAEEAWRSKEIETPWSFVAKGTFQRLQDGGRPVESRESIIPHVAYRYLRIKIDNGDDAPLSLRDFTVFRRMCSLIFESQSGTAYALYGGNPEAQAPEYDFARTLGGMDVAAIPKVGMQAIERLQPTESTIPWSERYWYLLSAVVIVAVLLMLWMIIPALRADGG
jgi:hypothetical protein